MNMLFGNELKPGVQREALAQFVHRFTGEHKPDWARKPWKNGLPYPVQHATDKDWLASTRFHVTKFGELSKRHRYCESSPTWPYNPELRK